MFSIVEFHGAGLRAQHVFGEINVSWCPGGGSGILISKLYGQLHLGAERMSKPMPEKFPSARPAPARKVALACAGALPAALVDFLRGQARGERRFQLLCGRAICAVMASAHSWHARRRAVPRGKRPICFKMAVSSPSCPKPHAQFVHARRRPLGNQRVRALPDVLQCFLHTVLSFVCFADEAEKEKARPCALTGRCLPVRKLRGTTHVFSYELLYKSKHSVVLTTPLSATAAPSAKPLVSELRRETIPGRLQPAAPLSAGGQNLARTLSVNMFDAFIIQAFAPDCKAFLAEGRRTRRKWRSGGMVYDKRKGRGAKRRLPGLRFL